MSEIYYRYDGCVVSVGGFSDLVTTRYELYCQEFHVTSRTPRGVWISNYGVKRFVLSGAKKRFACPTKLEAIESFIARKRRQIPILTKQLRNAEEALKVALEMKGRLECPLLLASGNPTSNKP